MNRQLIKLSVLFFFLGLGQSLFAQKNTDVKTYKGVINDDVPAILTVQATGKTDEYTLTIKIIGAESDQIVFTTTFAPNYDNTRKRYFGESTDGTGTFLYDVSKDAGKPALNILSGYTYSPNDDYQIRKMIFFLEK